MSDYVARKGTTAMSIIGTALGGVAALGGLGNMAIGTTAMEKDYFTKSEAQLMYDNTAKNSEIALLKANADTDKKLVDVYTAAADRDSRIRQEINEEFKNVRTELQNMQNNQNAINAAQAVDNATTASALAVMSNNQQNLQNIIGSLTKTVIPNSNVCPGFMPLPTYQPQYVTSTIPAGTTIA